MRWPAPGSRGPWDSSWPPTAPTRAAASTARTSRAPRTRSGPSAPAVEKIRVFYNHPDFIAANADRVAAALESIPAARRGTVRLAFTAHSIPSAMAGNCRYEEQLQETCRLVAEAVDVAPDRWRLVYQSRSGRPTDPWLGPDIGDHLDALHAEGVRDVVVQPVGFLSDHLEVLYDLDEEAAQRAAEARPEHDPRRRPSAPIPGSSPCSAS